MRPRPLVLIKGAGDLATGCAVRLVRSGFAVVMTELAAPTAVRRAVAFSEVVHEGAVSVEGTRARLCASVAEARRLARSGAVAVLVDPEDRARTALAPAAVVDARMAKTNLGTARGEAPVVIGLGPGFTAGGDVDAVIETNRGHALGSVILDGQAEPNTGVPGEIGGFGAERLLRAPAAGCLRARLAIGERVEAGALVGEVDGQPVTARIAGVLRGLVREGSRVRAGQKIGDVDPRARTEHCFSVSDKARSVAGGVLEAILHFRARATTAGTAAR
ncbi:MAG: EF2563 family selenium-dependent molybdenum hydroxylase system protein [Candidatus Rokubacteria bacterium]|nr:EF2563 family selenium-dependent molybdenum hydroxylase system protein [Candidatus Rokubacteria bacterium]